MRFLSDKQAKTRFDKPAIKAKCNSMKSLLNSGSDPSSTSVRKPK